MQSMRRMRCELNLRSGPPCITRRSSRTPSCLQKLILGTHVRGEGGKRGTRTVGSVARRVTDAPASSAPGADTASFLRSLHDDKQERGAPERISRELRCLGGCELSFACATLLHLSYGIRRFYAFWRCGLMRCHNRSHQILGGLSAASGRKFSTHLPRIEEACT